VHPVQQKRTGQPWIKSGHDGLRWSHIIPVNRDPLQCAIAGVR
jgi:hypothetical protein